MHAATLQRIAAQIKRINSGTPAKLSRSLGLLVADDMSAEAEPILPPPLVEDLSAFARPALSAQQRAQLAKIASRWPTNRTDGVEGVRQ